MLAIRMQRTGRKGHAQFRMIVQDSRFNPSSGRVVAYLGSYNPHTKAIILDKEKAATYIANGAQPSDRVAGILKAEGVKLPDWVSVVSPGTKSIRNPDKLRRNRPAEADTPAETDATADETPVEVADSPAKSEETEMADAPAVESSPDKAEEVADTKETKAEPASEDAAVASEEKPTV